MVWYLRSFLVVQSPAGPSPLKGFWGVPVQLTTLKFVFCLARFFYLVCPVLIFFWQSMGCAGEQNATPRQPPTCGPCLPCGYQPQQNPFFTSISLPKLLFSSPSASAKISLLSWSYTCRHSLLSHSHPNSMIHFGDGSTPTPPRTSIFSF